jgi:hypothetical protein
VSTRTRQLLVCALLACAATGCDPTKELRTQQSAGGVLRALEVLRTADNREKAKALRGLSQAPCFGEGVCELRDGCASAYTLHVEGVTLTQAAKQLLSDGKALEAAGLVRSAEEKLKEAGHKVEACLEQARALRQLHGLD